MLRAVLWTLRQRRYAALSVLMVLIAAGCVAMGTFELHRYQEKRSANSVLRDNAHAPAAPLTTSLVPLVGTSGGADVRYRTVVATGEYSGGDQYLVNESQYGSDGFYVLTPLRTSSGVLLVVRGFVAESATDPSRPARVVPVPTGPVQVRGWLQAGETAGDRHSGDLVFTVNPTEQAARLGVPVYRSFLVLTSGQPGVGTLGIVPPPGLSNPTGGAAAWQL
ncbi:MAG: SURF1 family protein, partial [Actinobacteria bacterium]|nr:SURF1 family protein [Actinomycetota bacterium]